MLYTELGLGHSQQLQWRGGDTYQINNCTGGGECLEDKPGFYDGINPGDPACGGGG